jgi:EmrB/QacA subfamily drug resistance transporter
VLFATVLGSGIAFLDGTVVNVALPALAKDLHAGVRGLQWIVDGYLITLSSFLLLGGALGDRYGRRKVFNVGLGVFGVASLLCGAAPSTGLLIVARALQGMGAALLVPESLAIISAVFRPEDRSTAVSAWSGLASISAAVGPFVGGWLITTFSWRLVFLINPPLAVVAIVLAQRHVPETRDEEAVGAVDYRGAVVVALGLGALAYGLIEQSIVPTLAGVILLGLFVAVEAREANPMLPVEILRSRQFSGANLTTLAVYAALGGVFFFLGLLLQTVHGYSPTEAGAAMLPSIALLLVLSPRMGRLAQRTGPRLPMTVGPLVMAVAILLLTRIGEGVSYASGVLPGITVFGLGLSITVGPLTSAVLAAVDDRHLGVGSAFNNAVARAAGMLAVAVLPSIAGINAQNQDPAELADGFDRAMVVSAALCAVGGAIAFLTIRRAAPVQTTATPLGHGCAHACVRDEGEAEAA